MINKLFCYNIANKNVLPPQSSSTRSVCRNKGRVFLELALITPILLALTVILIDFGRYLYIRSIVVTLTREAGVFAARTWIAHTMGVTTGTFTGNGYTDITAFLDYKNGTTYETTSNGFYLTRDELTNELKTLLDANRYPEIIGYRIRIASLIKEAIDTPTTAVPSIDIATIDNIVLPNDKYITINNNTSIGPTDDPQYKTMQSYWNSVHATDPRPDPIVVEVYIPYRPLLPGVNLIGLNNSILMGDTANLIDCPDDVNAKVTNPRRCSIIHTSVVF